MRTRIRSRILTGVAIALGATAVASPAEAASLESAAKKQQTVAASPSFLSFPVLGTPLFGKGTILDSSASKAAEKAAAEKAAADEAALRDAVAIKAAVEAKMKADAEAAANAWHVPVRTYVLSSYYGEWRGTVGHNGLDFAGPEGQDILAAKAGTVTYAGWMDGYGYTVEIQHADGLTTLYGHLMSHPYVAVGQHVAGGQVVGPLGTTGFSTGPHLHFEVKSGGATMDPLNFVAAPASTM